MDRTPDTRPTALFVSPHLDDVAFSCGGTVAAMRREGYRVAVATVFTASVPGPTGFALACQLNKGLGPEVDYMALRRGEDTAFGRSVDADELEWLGLPEAPHRGYHSAAELFAGVRPGDGIDLEVARALDVLIGRLRPRLIFVAQGVGGHADHRQVVRAVLRRPELASRVAWYRDLPYAEKYPGAVADPDLPGGLVEISVALRDADLEAKLDGCACYRTQIPFQFGGETSMRGRLATFAAAEGGRLGIPGPVETFLAPAAVLLGTYRRAD